MHASPPRGSPPSVSVITEEAHRKQTPPDEVGHLHKIGMVQLAEHLAPTDAPDHFPPEEVPLRLESKEFFLKGAP